MIAGGFAKASAFNREINWAHYEKSIAKEGLVASFKVILDNMLLFFFIIIIRFFDLICELIVKASFEATVIPVPSDEGLTAALEARAAEDEVAVADYVKKVDGQIDNASITLNNIKALPPFGKFKPPFPLYIV